MGRASLVVLCAAIAGCATKAASDGAGVSASSHGSAHAEVPATPAPAATPTPPGVTRHVQTVFLIVMENTNWSEFHHNASAPFIAHLIATAAHADAYHSVPGLHPSEPNYIWLESGASLGIKSDADPAVNHRATQDHLTALLRAADIPWKAYLQDTSGVECPLRSQGLYAAKHDPFVFFDDVTSDRDPKNAYCIAHLRPFAELARDLEDAKTTPRYAFIGADLCHDMHDSCAPLHDRIAQGDRWLQSTVEMIQASPAYQRGGAIFITWDENEGGNRPIGLILVSPYAKPHYLNFVKYTHSSTLKTVEELLGVQPLLGAAAERDTNDLSDLFRVFP